MIKHFLKSCQIEYIIQNDEGYILRYYERVKWADTDKVGELIDVRHAMETKIQLDQNYVLVTHHTHFFKPFQTQLKKNGIKYIKVDNPTNNNINQIMFNFMNRYGPGCHEKFSIDILFQKLSIERIHEYPICRQKYYNDYDIKGYTRDLAQSREFLLEIIDEEGQLYSSENDCLFIIKFVYDRFDIIDACNLILSNRSKRNVLMIMKTSPIGYKYRIPILITKEICRQHNRTLRVIRV